MNLFGLDIGSHSLKVAQVERRGKTANLIAFGSTATPPPGLLSESESDLTAVAEAIKRLHQDAKISTKNVAVALPEDQVFTRVVTTPKLSDEELRAALKWEAERFIPIPLEEVSYDYQVVGQTKEDQREKLEILIVAAPKRLIEKITKILKVADLTPVSLETEVVALSRSLIVPDSEVSILVDLGARATDIAIVEGGQVVFSRSTATGGEAFTRAIATGLGMEKAQAEEYKKAYGVDPKKLEGKVQSAIGPILEVIVKEIEKAIRFYQSNKKKPINRIILAGGTAGLPEVVSLLAQKLSLEIQVGNPFVRLEKDEKVLAKIPAGIAPLYAVAIGLALKEVR